MRTLILSSLLALPVVTLAAPVNLLTNGSFEDVGMMDGIQAQAANTWRIYSQLPGWRGGQFGIEVRNNVAGTAQHGSNFVELDTTRNSVALQEVVTSVGAWYDLSFWYAARPNTGNRASDTNMISVLWNGTALETVNQVSVGQHQWRQYSYRVMGTGLDALEFRAAGTSDSYGGSLDNVSLTVPEPGSLALVAGALAVAAGLRRRRV